MQIWKRWRRCSADWQSAVSQVGNLRPSLSRREIARRRAAAAGLSHTADYQSATQQINNLRYNWARDHARPNGRLAAPARINLPQLRLSRPGTCSRALRIAISETASTTHSKFA
jgi:hypothetical protein